MSILQKTMTYPSPSQLGLNYGWDDEWRPAQIEALDRILHSTRNIIIVDAPTGSGKTGIALALARYTKQRTFIDTHTTSLQDQYMREAGGLAKMIKGRSHYPCVLPEYEPVVAASCGVDDSTTAEDAPCTAGYTCVVREKGACPYYAAYNAAVAAPISVHNYAYRLRESNFIGGFLRARWLICDEGHYLPDALVDLDTFSITEKQLDWMTKRHQISILPGDRKDRAAWRIWVSKAVVAYRKLAARMPAYSADRSRTERRAADLERLFELLGTGSMHIGHDSFTGSYTFSPLWPNQPSRSLLMGRRVGGFSIAEKLVIMSATILDPKMYCKTLGIDPAFVEYVKLPYTFDPAIRPIYAWPVAKVTRASEAKVAPLLANAVDTIIDKHMGSKGIIHVPSYALGELVVGLSKHKALLLTHDRSSKGSILERFRRSQKGEWLVSPSIASGEDFRYDDARVQIILKVPWPSLGDPMVKLRAKDIPGWYEYKTMQELWQQVGRIVRAPDDFGETYILDASFEELVTNNPQYAPADITKAIHW